MVLRAKLYTYILWYSNPQHLHCKLFLKAISSEWGEAVSNLPGGGNAQRCCLKIMGSALLTKQKIEKFYPKIYQNKKNISKDNSIFWSPQANMHSDHSDNIF